MGWGGMEWDGMGWDGMGWDGMGVMGMGEMGSGQDGMGMVRAIGMDATSHPVLRDCPCSPPAASVSPRSQGGQPQLPPSCAAAGVEPTSVAPGPPPQLVQARIPPQAPSPHPERDRAGALAPFLPGLSSGETQVPRGRSVGFGRTGGFFGGVHQAGQHPERRGT